jgi:hydrogenase maturation protease
MNRVLIAGMGNVLHGDDGFGPAVIDALAGLGAVENGMRIADVGIGGIALVHELLDGFQALIVVDCVDRGAPPGTVFVLDVQVPPVETIPPNERLALVTDMHHVGPDRALLVARAAGVLPSRVWLVGCQPARIEECSMQLSAAVRDAVPAAVDAIRGLIAKVSPPVTHHARR